MSSSSSDSTASTGPVQKVTHSLSGKQAHTPSKSVQEPEESLSESPEEVGAEAVDVVVASSDDSTKAEKVRPLDRLKQLAIGRKSTDNTPEAAVGETGDDDDDDDDENEPTTLAEKIRSMIDALPSPTPRNSRTFPKPMPPARDAEGRPIPPPGAIPIKDKKLIAKLYNPNVMNAEGSESDSVWSILESLGARSHDGSTGGDNSSTWSDDSIMMYSPLFPTEESLVEIAASHIVPASNPPAPLRPQALWQRKWPWWKKAAAAPADGSTDKEKSREGNKPAAPATPIRVWIPSTTKISVQVMWWGYRLYLPPPVLAILSQEQLEATKRAATITAALTWLFTHIPISLLPPPVQPALLLLQKIVPYLGYIGTFISWSWSTIKGYDVGYGVILSATWLLPVALLPGTWQEADFPKPAPTTPPAGTPSSSTPSSPSFEAPTTTVPPNRTSAAPGTPVTALLSTDEAKVPVPVPPPGGEAALGAKKAAWWKILLPF